MPVLERKTFKRGRSAVPESLPRTRRWRFWRISEVVFDRGGYLYHGRVKALADSARENGLKF